MGGINKFYSHWNTMAINSSESIFFLCDSKMIELFETQEKLSVFLPKFNQFVINIIRNIPGKKYNPQNKTWEISSSQKESLCQQLKSNNLEYTFVEKTASPQNPKIDIFKYEDCAHLKLSHLDPIALDIIRSTEGRIYLAKEKLWKIPLEQLSKCHQRLKAANIIVNIINAKPIIVSLLSELKSVLNNI